MRFNSRIVGSLIALALALTLATVTATGAADGASRPFSLTGSWTVKIKGGRGTPALPRWYGSMVTFTSGGGLIATITDPNIKTGHGSWTRVGSRSFRVTILLWQFDSNGHFLGTLKAQATLNVGRSGRTLTSNNYRFSFSDPNGKPTGLAGVGSASGRRIPVER
jgi:hypothetical protein